MAKFMQAQNFTKFVHGQGYSLTLIGHCCAPNLLILNGEKFRDNYGCWVSTCRKQCGGWRSQWPIRWRSCHHSTGEVSGQSGGEVSENKQFIEGDLIEVDHIIAKEDRGTDKFVNLQPLHRHCHDVKTARDKANRRFLTQETVLEPLESYINEQGEWCW
ncbi:MAG: HNH endonuclease [Acaryochloris sp. CRU_2_0]|nr:HNH endonuclease [Acaryochloris sp. CRU_2_0]